MRTPLHYSVLLNLLVFPAQSITKHFDVKVFVVWAVASLNAALHASASNISPHGSPSKAGGGGGGAHQRSPGSRRGRVAREPRIGSFEVYVEVDSFDHRTGATVKRLTLTASKLQDK